MVVQFGAYHCPGLEKDKSICHPETFSHFLKGRNVCKLPLFQRRYCWQPRQLRKYFNDINELMGLKHTIGKFVLVRPKQEQSDLKNVFICIDGQQRVTTTSLLLCAVRDTLLAWLEDQDSSIVNTEKVNQGCKRLIRRIQDCLFHSASGAKDYLHSTTPETVISEGEELDFVRLIPTYNDRACFFSIVLQHDLSTLPKEAKESPMFVAKQVLDEMVYARLIRFNTQRGGPEPGSLDLAQRILTKLETFIKKTLERISFIHYEFTNEAASQQVFQWLQEKSLISGLVLHNKCPGIDIGHCDLIRNLLHSYFFFDISLQHEIYTKFWLKLERLFPCPNQDEKLNRFFNGVCKAWRKENPSTGQKRSAYFEAIIPILQEHGKEIIYPEFVAMIQSILEKERLKLRGLDPESTLTEPEKGQVVQHFFEELLALATKCSAQSA